MKDLGKWQIVSFISRMSAMAVGLVQSFVIAAVLTKAEWGIVQLAVSIGGALGIYQHLGLASASTREISSVKKEEDIFKIFITSIFVRYCVTLPIALAFLFFSRDIAVGLYKNELLTIPLRIYGLTMLVQGMQSILNSVISGTKRFKQLFIYQVAISVVSVLLFIPLVYYYRILGYFYAFFLFNFISSLILAVIAFKPLKGKLALPSFPEFKIFIKEIFSISIAIYLMKIIYTNWEKFGSNTLGLFSSPEVVATYAFALLYAKKLMSISDAVTDVNLPVLSDKYSKNILEFKELFTRNFNKIFTAVVLVGVVAAYWAPFVIRLAVGHKYDDSFIYIPPLIMTFIVYSFANIVNASVLIPAKMTKGIVISFLLLLVSSIVYYYLLQLRVGLLSAMSWAMALGSITSFLYMLLVIKKKLNFVFVKFGHFILMGICFLISLACPADVLLTKTIGFVIILPIFVWLFIFFGMVKVADVTSVLDRGVLFARKYLK